MLEFNEGYTRLAIYSAIVIQNKCFSNPIESTRNKLSAAHAQTIAIDSPTVIFCVRTVLPREHKSTMAFMSDACAVQNSQQKEMSRWIVTKYDHEC